MSSGGEQRVSVAGDSDVISSDSGLPFRRQQHAIDGHAWGGAWPSPEAVQNIRARSTSASLPPAQLAPPR
jgi:hypothetical protein